MHAAASRHDVQSHQIEHHQIEHDHWAEVSVLLPKRAGDELLGKSAHVLRSAMRRAHVIMTVQYVASSAEHANAHHQHLHNATVLTIQGAPLAIHSTHAYLGEWSSISQPQIEQQLAQQLAQQQAVPPVSPAQSEQSQREESQSASQTSLAVACDRRQGGMTGIICTKTDVAKQALGAILNIPHTTHLPILCVRLWHAPSECLLLRTVCVACVIVDVWHLRCSTP